MVKLNLKSLLVGSVCLSFLLSSPTRAQQSGAEDPDSFTSENAILDTSLLFAIGAREARQELRGSFGWPTFQEGLVEGVYFRFDPDGYARFSPSPRLDTDVFEVICRPRTYTCMGRKNGLVVALTSRGTVQLRLDNVVETDQFFVADGVSELALPQNILQPLDPRLELLLSSGGELVVKRRDAEADRISLVGFAAVSAYLRWISSRQDYVVLPRGWPVPNSDASVATVGLTQAASWQSPMPQPLIPQEVQAGEDQRNLTQIATIAESSKGAFDLLKEITDPNAGRSMPVTLPVATDTQTMMVDLKRSIDELTHLLQSHAACETQNVAGEDAGAPLYAMQEDGSENGDTAKQHIEMKDQKSLASRLEFLIEEMGLPADLALVVAQQGAENEGEETENQSDVVSDILGELRSQLKTENIANETPSESADYKLLSEYFRSSMQ